MTQSFCIVFLTEKSKVEITNFISMLNLQAWFIKKINKSHDELQTAKPKEMWKPTQRPSHHILNHTHTHTGKHPDTFDAMYPTMNPGS